MAREKFVRLPDGRELTFPVSMTDAEIKQKVLGELFATPKFEEVKAPKKPPSFFEAFGEGATSLGDVPEALRYLYDPRSAEARKEAAGTTESPYAYTGVSDIEGPSSLGRFVKEQAGQALGFMAAPAAASMAAGAVSGPFAPIVAPATFLTVAGAQYLAQTTGRQAAEQEKKIKEGKTPELPDVTVSLLTSAGQAGLDIAGFRFFKPLGNLLGLSGREAVKDTAVELVKIAEKEGVEKAASILAGTAKGVGYEAAQETIQQLLERTGAGLELNSDEAIREYFESAVAGGILGGAMGAGSAAYEKVGTKAKDELYKLAQEAREAKDPKVAWKDAKKDILKETKPLSLVDEAGAPVPITREFLESVGVNPEAKALVGTPMENILNQPATDGGVAQTLVKYFNDKIQDINTQLERKDLTDEQRSELTGLYEKLSVGLKTFTQRAQESEKARKEAEREAQTIPVFKLPEGFEFKKPNEKSLAGELIDPQGKSRGKFASIEEAALFANTLYKPPVQPEVVPEAPAEPAPAPQGETVDTAIDKLAEVPVEAEPSNVIDITERLDLKDEADLEAGILETERQQAQAALTPEINKEISEALVLAQQVIDEGSTVDKRGQTFFPEDTARAQEFAEEVNNVYAGLESGNLPYAVNTINSLRERANNLKATFQQRIADREAYEKGKETAAPEPELTQEAQLAPMPEPVPEVAEQINYLREELGMDGLASAIASQPAPQQVTLAKQVSDTLAQIDQLETNRRTLKAQGDQASAKAVGEQIRKLENSLDDLEYSLTQTPNTRQEVQAVIKQNGNAAEANKIAEDVRKENGCK